jgi:hypothetical protein
MDNQFNRTAADGLVKCKTQWMMASTLRDKKTGNGRYHFEPAIVKFLLIALFLSSIPLRATQGFDVSISGCVSRHPRLARVPTAFQLVRLAVNNKIIAGES